jgi:hypothetical protein
MSIDVILYIIALVLAILAGLGVDARGHNLLAWAFAVFVLSLLI